MKNISRLFLLLCFLASPPLHASPSLEDSVVTHQLSNGMKFLLVKRSGAPVFTSYLRVKVGGADEKDGYTGIAHMLEHMAFKGTSTIGTSNFSEEKKILDAIEVVGVKLSELTRSGKGDGPEAAELKKEMAKLQEKADRYVVKDELSRAFTMNGASNFNATTSTDMTSYFVELPTAKLELWAYLESERLRDPVFREFYQERDVVLEERRSRVEDSPFGRNFESFLGLAFEKSPYRRPTIGFTQDVAALTATDLKAFYKTYYVPSNMVGVLAGDLDIPATEALLDKYFGRIPAGNPPPVLKEVEPEQTQEKRGFVAYDARPQIMIGYHKPTLPSREDYVFDMIGQILCEGRTSRLHRALVEDHKLAQAVDCDAGTPGARLNNLFFIYVSALGSTSPAVLESAVYRKCEKLKNKWVSPEEMKRAVNQLIAERVFKLDSNTGLAESISYFESATGDWRYFLKHEDVIKTITAGEIREVARKYFVKTNRTVSVLARKGA